MKRLPIYIVRCVNVCLLGFVVGDVSYGQRINAIPVERVPPQMQYASERADGPVDVAGLRQKKAPNYLLDKGDVLGVFVEGVLGETGSSPPVNYPPPGSDLAPSMGFPTVVREDGTISLPLIDSLPVRGLTIVQAEQLVKRAFLDGEAPLLQPSSRILVSLMRERTIRVTVVREDNSYASGRAGIRGQGVRGVNERSDQSGRVQVLNLPAYKNDLLNALVDSGGIPGLNAVPEVKILRDRKISSASLHAIQQNYPTNAFPRSAGGQRHRSRANASWRSYSQASSQHRSFRPTYSSRDSIRVPLRGFDPSRQARSVLKDGDVVQVEAKPTEVFYTGGLLGGGEYSLPRDKDLNVVEAISSVGGSFASGRLSGVAPTELIVLRNVPGQGQVNFRVDLNQALSNPSARPLVAPGDTLILRHSPAEQAINFGLGVFRTYGVRQLFR